MCMLVHVHVDANRLKEVCLIVLQMTLVFDYLFGNVFFLINKNWISHFGMSAAHVCYCWQRILSLSRNLLTIPEANCLALNHLSNVHEVLLKNQNVYELEPKAALKFDKDNGWHSNG